MATVYEIITEEIIKKLEAGTIPWQKPWQSAGTPKNFISKKEYRGINTLMLGMTNFTCPYWLTFKQAMDLKGNVKKGEKSQIAVFWKFFDNVKDEDEDDITKIHHDSKPILRYYRIFNLEQCEGINWIMPEGLNNENLPIENCETVIKDFKTCPEIQYGGDRAYYQPSNDKIQLPAKESFINSEEYYSTLFHECVHSTGHETRLNRKGISELSSFGSESYSKEELIAEIGASFLCGKTRIKNKTIDNSASYINSWLRKLKGDTKLVVMAASGAQKAVDYITNKPES